MIASILGGIAAALLARAALRYGAMALAIVLFLLSIRRSGERVGRIAERLDHTEKTNEIQRRMLEAAARRPRDRDELVGYNTLQGVGASDTISLQLSRRNRTKPLNGSGLTTTSDPSWLSAV